MLRIAVYATRRISGLADLPYSQSIVRLILFLRAGKPGEQGFL